MALAAALQQVLRQRPRCQDDRDVACWQAGVSKVRDESKHAKGAGGASVRATEGTLSTWRVPNRPSRTLSHLQC